MPHASVDKIIDLFLTLPRYNSNSQKGINYLISPQKRAFDRAMCRVALQPLSGLTGIVSRHYLKDDAEFNQKRRGANGEIFEVHKWRTLDSDGRPVHPLANFFRAIGGDDARQIDQVKNGDMFVTGTHRAMVENEYNMILDNANPKLVKRRRQYDWLKPSVLSTHSLEGHLRKIDFGDPMECDYKLETDIEDIENASLSRDIRRISSFGNAIIKLRLKDPKKLLSNR